VQIDVLKILRKINNRITDKTTISGRLLEVNVILPWAPGAVMLKPSCCCNDKDLPFYFKETQKYEPSFFERRIYLFPIRAIIP
jgi:hypothetical protein